MFFINAEADSARSDYAGNATKLSKILLNGNNICMVRSLVIQQQSNV